MELQNQQPAADAGGNNGGVAMAPSAPASPPALPPSCPPPQPSQLEQGVHTQLVYEKMLHGSIKGNQCNVDRAIKAQTARRFFRNSFTLLVTRMTPSLITSCEPHSVAAVDKMMETVVRMVRLIKGDVITETEEENRIDSWNGPKTSPMTPAGSMIELWRVTVRLVNFCFTFETAFVNVSSTVEVTKADTGGDLYCTHKPFVTPGLPDAVLVLSKSAVPKSLSDI